MSDIKISNQSQRQIADWQALKSNDMWPSVVKEMNNVIKQSNIIINAFGADSKPEFSKRDIAISKKMVAMILRDLPDRMIAQLKGSGTTILENMDAFEDEDYDPEEELEMGGFVGQIDE